MPYKDTSELPKSIRESLPKHAQEIYMNAFNNAYDLYKDPAAKRHDNTSREETAHKVAWAAVKKDYHKEGDAWVAN